MKRTIVTALVIVTIMSVFGLFIMGPPKTMKMRDNLSVSVGEVSPGLYGISFNFHF